MSNRAEIERFVKDPSLLVALCREVRSKGVVVFFASQSLNDHQQRFFNFQPDSGTHSG